MLPNDLSLIFMGMKQEKGMDEYVPHSSPWRLAGEKKVTAIIIKQQFGFPIRTT